MTDIRHNYDETDRLAKRMGEHADHLEATAGEHTRNANRRLAGTHGKDPLANAVVGGSSRILKVIKDAEREVRQHLRDVQKGLDLTSRNHKENDEVLANMIKKIHDRSEAQDKARLGEKWKDRAKGPDQSLKPHTVTLKWKPFMSRTGFARKAQQMHALGRRGELYKASNPVDRDRDITDTYKGAVVRIIYRDHGKTDPEFAEAAASVARSMHPDHINELQTGGRDHWENIRMLDGKTNTDLGNHQTWPNIRKLKDGTPIKVKVRWRK
ncbi:hypothetical protein [Kitasatospora sp. NPDC001175]|uniref:hypothetical protein n=1 Tax=Kitasatospora sp. NPDC001175 TaxID=3157103 RepID=UPI003D00DB26